MRIFLLTKQGSLQYLALLCVMALSSGLKYVGVNEEKRKLFQSHTMIHGTMPYLLAVP